MRASLSGLTLRLVKALGLKELGDNIHSMSQVPKEHLSPGMQSYPI